MVLCFHTAGLLGTVQPERKKPVVWGTSTGFLQHGHDCSPGWDGKSSTRNATARESIYAYGDAVGNLHLPAFGATAVRMDAPTKLGIVRDNIWAGRPWAGCRSSLDGPKATNFRVLYGGKRLQGLDPGISESDRSGFCAQVVSCVRHPANVRL